MRPNLASLQTVRLVSEQPPIALRARKGPLDEASRAELLEAVKAGREVELEMDIVAFEQTERPNKNFVRVTPAFARKLARSLSGKHFIRDHAHGDLNAVGGQILSSTWEGSEGVGQIKQTVRLTYPWAVEHALRGGMRFFSVAWTPNGLPTCSACGEQMSLFASGCTHWPGDEVTLRDGSKSTVEAVCADGDGIETSAVLVPATETSLMEIRAALSAHRNARAHRPEALSADPADATAPSFAEGDRVEAVAEHMPGMSGMVGTIAEAHAGAPPYYAVQFEDMDEPHKWLAEDEIKVASGDEQMSARRRSKETQMKTIATMLGLAEAANEATIAGAVEKLKTEHATELAAHAQTKTALATAQSKLEAVEASSRAQKLEALVESCYRDGKIAGEKGKNEVEKAIRELAALQFSGAEAFVRTMPKVVPVGAPVSQETRQARGGNVTELSAQQLKIARSLKLTPEAYLKQLQAQQET